MVKSLRLRFLDWSKKFHVHVDASNVIVKVVLAQFGYDLVDNPNVYASRKLNKVERNYSNIEQEGSLGMIFSLQKFGNYLLANPFVFYTNHPELK